MKTIKLLFGTVVLSLLFAGCSTGYTTYAYDDLYYSPNNDPVKQVQKNPREDFNKTNNIQYDGSYDNRYANEEKPSNYPESIYQNRYTQAEQAENQGQAEAATESSEDIEYYDEDYANTLQQLNSPVRSFDTYNSYQRDRIIYTNDPFFVTPSIYGRYSFWDPFVPATGLSIGWNSFNGWNVGIGAGFGCVAPLNPFGFYDPFFNPYNNFYGGFGGFWGDPFFGNRWNRWNGWNTPYGWNNAYWAGYNNGFNNGYYGNGFYNGNYDGGSSAGRRRITTARGNSGSRSVSSSGTTRPTRPTRSNRVSTTTPTGTNAKPTNRPTRTVATGAGSSEEVTNKRPTRTTTTPNQYKTPKNPSYYSKPRETSRPSRTVNGNNNTPRQTIKRDAPVQQNSRPSYTRPRQNNSYNNSNRVTPRQQRPTRQQTKPRQQQYSQPRQQSRPNNNYNRSRPSYNRSTPSYNSPSRSTTRSSGSNSSRPTRPSRR